MRWGEVDHWSLAVFGLSLLWLLSSIASGLFSQRMRGPSVYSRDLNRWLRLYALEWRGKERQLRCLTPQQMARRRGKRERGEALREAERERLHLQRKTEEEAERERLAFLEQLEKEEDSERESHSNSAGLGGGGGLSIMGGGGGSEGEAERVGGIAVRVVGERRRRSGVGSLSGMDSLLPISETLVMSEADSGTLTSASDYPQQDIRRRWREPQPPTEE
jgi:hypothetical protein